MRWGNFDTVTNGVRWVGSEVPSGRTPGDPQYGNGLPKTENLAKSWFHGSQPTSWWSTPWGTPPWPPIGPDVINGSAYGMGPNALVGGFANDIPAALCWFNTPIDTAYTTGTQAQGVNLTLTQNGTTATATSNSALPSSFSAAWPVNISGASVAGYNKNWRITSLAANSFTFTALAGLGTATGATATPSPILRFNSSNCYGAVGVTYDNAISSGFNFA